MIPHWLKLKCFSSSFFGLSFASKFASVIPHSCLSGAKILHPIRILTTDSIPFIFILLFLTFCFVVEYFFDKIFFFGMKHFSFNPANLTSMQNNDPALYKGKSFTLSKIQNYILFLNFIFLARQWFLFCF